MGGLYTDVVFKPNSTMQTAKLNVYNRHKFKLIKSWRVNDVQIALKIRSKFVYYF